MDVVNSVFEWIKNIFSKFNNWLASITKFDHHILNLYNKLIAPLSEWVKILGLLFVLFALVLGIIQIIKKSFKLAIVILIIIGIIVLFTWL